MSFNKLVGNWYHFPICIVVHWLLHLWFLYLFIFFLLMWLLFYSLDLDAIFFFFLIIFYILQAARPAARELGYQNSWTQLVSHARPVEERFRKLWVCWYFCRFFKCLSRIILIMCSEHFPWIATHVMKFLTYSWKIPT